ncbi:ABC transporter ATP-binding protein [Sulfidibacter corallicola]|uniref:ABC transporter ATP-binding protein n=1 Tax=Sulfidibacter corallicola TaxID=2818388 RepID=A0A8A4TTB6_SULCO|nr:ABC transporter ATP-binding protein [Sulfidibacter corallicola]QTD49785.1 ABC transporter ATP-binding protein [Sulfidibacter corallicola]
MMLQRDLLGLAARQRKGLALCVLLGSAVSAAGVGQGVLIASGIKRILEGAPFEALHVTLAGILVLVVTRAALLWWRRLREMRVAAAIKHDLRGRLFRHLLKLGPGYLQRTHSGKVQATMVDGVEALEGYFGAYVPQFFVTLVVSTSILAWITAIDPAVGGLVLAALLIAAFAPKLWERWLGDYGASHWSAYEALNTRFVDAMQGMTTLKAFNAAERRGASLRAESHRLYKATMAQLAVSMLSTGVVGLAKRAGTALALALGSVRLLQGALTPAELLLLLFLTSECLSPLAELDAAWHQGYMGISASAGIFAILRAEPEIPSPPGASLTASPMLDPHRAPAISLSEVSFQYEPGRPALDRLSLTLAPGETTAIVGPSGSGKSTIVALLLRFFDPNHGTITIEGHDLRDLNPDELRRRIAVVHQDTYLFHGTIAENLRLGRPDANPVDLEEAARAAGAHDFICHLPQGYQTLVGERGLTLSGGERQRLAIARALLQDAPILILDEATANLDAANEATIHEALQRLRQGRTTLVIAHRLNTVAHADRIAVLAQGRIEEIGTAQDLLDEGGAFARMAALQEVSA